MKLLLVLVAITLLFLQAFADASLLGNAADNLATRNEANDALALYKKHSHGKINCKFACKNRCKESSRKKICHRACTSCCKRCHCVPPGTYGNKKACPCYASLRTHANKPKCP